jgi:hypothetical protein
MGVALAAVASQPAAAQPSDAIQEAIRGLRVTQVSPIRGERILAEPLELTAGALGAMAAGAARPAVFGIVLNHLGALLPNAGTVLIRSISNGSIVADVQVDARAQFTARGFEPGLYTAQLVDRGGNILASSGAFTAGIGEVIQLATIVPAAPVSNIPSMLSNTTQSVISSASSAGVLALDSGTPISP